MTIKRKLFLALLCIVTNVFLSIEVGVVWAKNYNSESYGAGAFSTGETLTCNYESPKGTILIESISFGISEMIVRFEGMKEPFKEFEIESGSSASFGSDSLGNITFGNKTTNEYRFENLTPNKTYFFRVRAIYECAKGDWSNTISATTLSSENLTSQEENNPTKVVRIITTESNVVSPESFNLQINVLTKKGIVIEGAMVTIEDLNITNRTNREGRVEFLSVPKGVHKITVVAPKIMGVQTINLDKNYVQDFIVTIQEVETKMPIPKGRTVTLGLSILGAGVLFMILRLIKNRE